MMRIVSCMFSMLLFACFCNIDCGACMSAIVSSGVSADGRPLLWKHRDADCLDSRLEHFTGPIYGFVGLVDSCNDIKSEREVWIGANTAGFSIMNTASYNPEDGDVPHSGMGREGVLIYKALGICGSLAEFEHLLDSLPKPLGVEANFGVIDAFGGAAYYEVNNHSWVKFDVNDVRNAPDGYMVVTNFSLSGRKKDYRGYERYLTASAIMKEAVEDSAAFTPGFLVDALSRSFRHEFLGVDYSADYSAIRNSGFCNGIVVDQDFIPRESTSSSVVVQGVAAGENPQHTVMWALLGYPMCSVSIPVPVSDMDLIPSYMKKSEEDPCSSICSTARSIKDRFVFRFGTGSGRKYLDMDMVLAGKDWRPSLASCCRRAEDRIVTAFMPLYSKWVSGEITFEEYVEVYDYIVPYFWDMYAEEFVSFISRR